MRLLAILGLLFVVTVAVGQATQDPAAVQTPTVDDKPWNAPLEQLVPPQEDLREVLPQLKALREDLKRAAMLEKVLDHLEQASTAGEEVTADQVYEQLGLFRFPTLDELSIAIEKTKEPEDVLDQELFKAFARDASLGEVLTDPRLVQRFLQSKRVTDGTMRLNRRLARRLRHAPLRESLTLENVANGLGLDERATTLDLMEAALEVFQGSRDVSLRLRLGDVPVTIRIPSKATDRTEPAPEVDIRGGEAVDLDDLVKPLDDVETDSPR